MPPACPLPVVKLGADGALAHDGCRLVRVDAPAVDVVDTVGAGDSLDAGFLCGRLSGWDVGRSLALGVVCGSLSTRSAGGVDAQPSRAEAEAAMAGLLPHGDGPEECGTVSAATSGLEGLTGILAANRRGEQRGVTSVCSAQPVRPRRGGRGAPRAAARSSASSRRPAR